MIGAIQNVLKQTLVNEQKNELQCLCDLDAKFACYIDELMTIKLRLKSFIKPCVYKEINIIDINPHDYKYIKHLIQTDIKFNGYINHTQKISQR